MFPHHDALFVMIILFLGPLLLLATKLQQLLEPQDTMRFFILCILSALALVHCMGNIS